MKFNPAVFAGGLTGGVIAGNTGDDYEVLPSIAGATIGGFAGSKMNLELPSGMFDSVKTQIDTSTGVTSYRSTKADYMNQLTELLTANSQGVVGESLFDPSKPASSINETNLKSALRYYEQVSDTELKKALTVLREGEEAVIKLNPEALNDSYQVQHHFVRENESLETKKMMLSKHLAAVEHQNVPSVNQSTEMAVQRAARVEELAPFLDKLEGRIIFEDGQLKSVLAGQSFTMPLTQTITDGETLGHNINNNVYTSRKFNIMGSVIASGAGSTVEGASEIATKMGLSVGSLEHSNVVDMLVNKSGITREATLGVLASTKGVTDKSLLAAVEKLSEKTQWDESATSLHLEARVDSKNGYYDDYRNSQYTKTQASLIDMSTTIKHDQGNFGDLSESALRGVRTSTSNTHDGVESHKIIREVKAMGEDRVSGVKADHSLIFTPVDNSSKLMNINSPYNRNTGTVTNRALAVSVKGDADRFSTERLRGVFGADAQLGSAVTLRTALFDEEVVSKPLAAIFGANVTLDDGYALGNRESFSQLEHTGYTKLKLHSGVNNEIIARSPMLNHLIDGSATLEEVKDLADTHLNFKAPRRSTLEKANLSFATAIEALESGLDGDAIGELVDPRYKGLAKMLKGIDYSAEKELEQSTLGRTPDEEDLFIKNRRRQGIIDYFSKRTSVNEHQSTTDFGRGIAKETNTDLYEARANFLRTGDMSTFKEELGQALDTYQGKRDVIRDAARTVYVKGGRTVGFGVSGEAVQLSKSYDHNELVDLEHRVDAQGRVSVEATYKGSTNVGDNSLVKTFSVNYKDQNFLLEGAEFKQVGAISEMLTKGTLVYNEANNSFTHAGNEIQASDILPYFKSNVGFAALASKYEGVDTISSMSNAGYKYQEAIKESIKKEGRSSLLSDAINETISSYSKRARSKDEVVSGLTDFVYAMSNEKPSTAALAETVLKADEALSTLNTQFRTGRISALEYLTATGTYGSGVSRRSGLQKKEVIIDKVMTNYNNTVEKLAYHTSTKEGAYAMHTDASVRKEIADIFVENSKLSSKVALGGVFNSIQDNVHLNISAINRKVVTETGAGTFDKSMSWNAQTQLLANGYTKEELDLFASFDKAAVNDMNALTGMTRKHDTLLNKYFEANPSAMRNVMNAVPEDRRKVLEEAFGYTPNAKDTDFYNLHYKPKSGIRAIPLIFDESRGFDSYTDSKDTGAKHNKRINSLMTDIIDADIKLRSATDHDDIANLQTHLEGLHTRLESAIKPTLGGSSGALKAAMTRHGDASLLATVGAVNGQMVDFIDQEIKAKRGVSYASVSYHGALDRLKLAGVELTEAEETDFLRGQSKYLEDVEGFSGLKRVKVSDDLPLFSLINREPAQGPMSIRAVEYMVDTSIKDSEDIRASVFMRHKDPIYKYLQFGDYDFDTMTEYFAKSSGSKENAQMLESVLSKGRKLSADYAELVDFADKLGVKNNKSDNLKSLFDILAENPDIKTYNQWHEKYLDSIYDDTTKAGLRKTISPKVTMLASQLNNSLMASTSDMSSKNIQAGRVLSHYFVENLLKAQHSSNSASSETVAELLSRLKEQAVRTGNKSEYLDELAKGLTDQLKNLNPASSDYKMGQEAISAIITAEKTHMTGDVLNPMELAGANRNKNLREALQTAADVYEGKNQSIGLHKTVKVDADIADYAKVGYDRFKTTAKQLFHNNKKVLGYSAAGLAGVAIAFRDNPDEAYKQSATADVGRQTLAPNKMEAPVEGQASGSPSEYVTPHRDARRAVTVEGQHVGRREDARYNAQKSIFGDSIESAQVEYRE